MAVLCGMPIIQYLYNIALRDLGVTHKVHRRLDGKSIVDFLLVIIKLFSLALTAAALLSKICRNWRFLKVWITLSANYR